ncbi:MAG: phytochrome sensor protein [Gemmatimonadota bacterium]|nr:MAG: phytochrome sensor protein [Gemmatimonadota bacterium]
MATFAFSARDLQGRPVDGRRVAANEGDLRRILRSDGILLVRAKQVNVGAGAARVRRVKPAELILFTFNMVNVLDSGVPILSGLEDLVEETGDPGFRAVIQDVRDRLTAGETLTQAMSAHPRVFDRQYVNMVDAGEQSGQLPKVFERLLQQLEWREAFRRKLKDLTTYPTIILFALIGLVGLVIGFVFPRFAVVFERVNFELPWSTRFLISVSDFVTGNWLGILLGGALIWAGVWALFRIERVRFQADVAVLKIPVVGDLVEMLCFSQIAQAFGSFLDSGIGVPHALEMIAAMVPNRKIAAAVREARDSILGGSTISNAFRESGVFPRLVVRMVRMGEQSGQLVSSLAKASKIYDREIPLKTKAVMDLMNPILTVVMGGLLLFVVLSVMTPLYKMYQDIGTSY